MGLQKTLTKEWRRFDGDYEKSMQDIKLHDGKIIMMCWPNAGVFICCCEKRDSIPYEEVAFVRLTHHEKWTKYEE